MSEVTAETEAMLEVAGDVMVWMMKWSWATRFWIKPIKSLLIF